MTTQVKPSYAELERRLEERTAELAESLEQQAATSEILRVISSSPTDIQPVFDAIAKTTARVYGARSTSPFGRWMGTLPVIAVTASAMPEDRKKILAAGFEGMQTKPIHVVEFLSAVERALNL